MATAQKRTFRPIALLTGAEFWGSIGVQIALFVAPLIALEIFDATPMHIAALNLTESAAALIFGLAVAGFVDKLGGARAITFANALRVLSCTVVAVSLITRPSLWILFVALFLLGIASLLNEAGLNTAVVEFVGRDSKSLNRANSLLRSSGVLSELGGIGLGGLVVSLLTFATTMLVGSFTFGIALVLSLVVWLAAPQKPRPTQEPSQTDTSRPSFNGLRFIWNNDFLKRLTLTSFHFNFFSSIFQAVFIIYCVRVLGFEPWALAIVGVAGGIGGLVGAGVASTPVAETHAKKLYCLAITLPSVSILTMLAAQLVSNIPARIALVALPDFAFGLCMVLCIVLFNTAKQQCSPDSMVGDIAATERTIALGGEVPGFLLGGAIATVISVQYSMAAAVVGILFSAVWMLRLHHWPAPQS